MYIDNSAPEIPNRKIIVKNSTIRTSEIKTNLKIASPSNNEVISTCENKKRVRE